MAGSLFVTPSHNHKRGRLGICSFPGSDKLANLVPCFIRLEFCSQTLPSLPCISLHLLSLLLISLKTQVIEI